MLNDIAKQKQQLREYIKSLLARFDDHQLLEQSNRVVQQLLSHPKIMQGKVIACYWPLQKELNLISFIQQLYLSKTILLPSILNDQMVFKPFNGACHLKPTKYGFLEPDSEICFDLNLIDVIIVPGLAFDHENNRLGRGKGFYDNFLNQCLAYKIGVGYNFQLLTKIPSNSFDVKMDEVLTA